MSWKFLKLQDQRYACINKLQTRTLLRIWRPNSRCGSIDRVENEIYFIVFKDEPVWCHLRPLNRNRTASPSPPPHRRWKAESRAVRTRTVRTQSRSNAERQRLRWELAGMGQCRGWGRRGRCASCEWARCVEAFTCWARSTCCSTRSRFCQRPRCTLYTSNSPLSSFHTVPSSYWALNHKARARIRVLVRV